MIEKVILKTRLEKLRLEIFRGQFSFFFPRHNILRHNVLRGTSDLSVLRKVAVSRRPPSTESPEFQGAYYEANNTLSTRGGSPLELQIHGLYHGTRPGRSTRSRFNARHFARNSSQIPRAENAPSSHHHRCNLEMHARWSKLSLQIGECFFNYATLSPSRTILIPSSRGFFQGFYRMGTRFDRENDGYCSIPEIKIAMDKQILDKMEDTIMRFCPLLFEIQLPVQKPRLSRSRLELDRIGFDPAEGKSESAKREKSLSVVS